MGDIEEVGRLQLMVFTLSYRMLVQHVSSSRTYNAVPVAIVARWAIAGKIGLVAVVISGLVRAKDDRVNRRSMVRDR